MRRSLYFRCLLFEIFGQVLLYQFQLFYFLLKGNVLSICCVFCYNNLPAKNVLSEYVCDYKKRAGLFQRSADLE